MSLIFTDMLRFNETMMLLVLITVFCSCCSATNSMSDEKSEQNHELSPSLSQTPSTYSTKNDAIRKIENLSSFQQYLNGSEMADSMHIDVTQCCIKKFLNGLRRLSSDNIKIKLSNLKKLKLSTIGMKTAESIFEYLPSTIENLDLNFPFPSADYFEIFKDKFQHLNELTICQEFNFRDAVVSFEFLATFENLKKIHFMNHTVSCAFLMFLSAIESIANDKTKSFYLNSLTELTLEFCQNPFPTAADFYYLEQLNGVTVLRTIVYGRLFQIKNFNESDKMMKIEKLVVEMNSRKIQHENELFQIKNFNESEKDEGN